MTIERSDGIGILVHKSKIKRLSTPSSASQDIIKKAEKYYTTWCWYEMTGSGTWKQQVSVAYPGIRRGGGGGAKISKAFFFAFHFF